MDTAAQNLHFIKVIWPKYVCTVKTPTNLNYIFVFGKLVVNTILNFLKCPTIIFMGKTKIFEIFTKVGSKEFYLLVFKDLLLTGIMHPLEFKKKYFCLSLYLFLSVCFHAVRGIFTIWKTLGTIHLRSWQFFHNFYYYPSANLAIFWPLPL